MQDKLKQTLMVLGSVYDEINVIDPVTKEVLFDKSCRIINESLCFELCGGDKICSNCIGMRAFNEEKSSIKLNFNDESPVIITAIPIIIDDKKYIIEAIKKIDDISFVDGIKFDNKDDLRKYIDDINESIVKDERTEIFNSRYAYERLPTEIEFSRMGKYKVLVILLYVELTEDFKNEFMGDLNIFEIISIISANINQKSDWISRIQDNKFLIVINRESEYMCYRVYRTIIEELEKRSLEYGDTKLTLYFYTCEDDLYNMVYDSKALIEHIKINVKR